MGKYEKECIHGELSHFAPQQKLTCVLCVLSRFSRVGFFVTLWTEARELLCPWVTQHCKSTILQ